MGRQLKSTEFGGIWAPNHCYYACPSVIGGEVRGRGGRVRERGRGEGGGRGRERQGEIGKVAQNKRGYYGICRKSYGCLNGSVQRGRYRGVGEGLL